MCNRNAVLAHFLFFFASTIVSSRFKCVTCEKVLLVSFERLPYNLFDIARTHKLNISAFTELFVSGCIYNHIPLQNISSENHAHSILINGQFKEEVVYNTDDEYMCDDFIFSKLYSHSENLWASVRRNGFGSASFYWPEDYLKVNGSSPLLSAGVFASMSEGIPLYLDVIAEWLSLPNVKFVSAYIPAAKNALLTNVIMSANRVLGQLVQAVRNNKLITSTVNFLLLGGVSPPKSSLTVSDVKAPTSWFRSYVFQGRSLEVWPSSQKSHSLEKDTAHYFSCNTKKFRERHPYLNIGVLPPLYLVAKPGYVLRVKGSEEKEEEEETETVPSSAFLLAAGPYFKNCSSSSNSSSTAPTASAEGAIQLTDIYSLVSWLLGIRRPSRHAGRLSRVRHLLRVPPTAMQLEQFERSAMGQPQLPALLHDPYMLAFSISIILLPTALALVFCYFACRHRLGACCCVCCLRGAAKRRAQRARRWRKLHVTEQDSALLGTAANGDAWGSQEGRFLGSGGTEMDDISDDGAEEMVILDKRARYGDTAAFLNMLHGPLESGQSRMTIPYF